MTVRLGPRTKDKINKASIFVAGVIVTIVFVKASDRLFPSDPIVVKEVNDTVNLVHDYRIPEELNDDSVRAVLENRIRSLELLNNYDKQIKDRITTFSHDELVPNLILTEGTAEWRKGYIYGSSSSYFYAECPSLLEEYIDFKIDFFNPEISTRMAYLRLAIYRFDGTGSRTFVLEDFYEVKPRNLIRISNDLSKGKYEIMFGFTLKADLSEKYPEFHFKRCVLTK